MNAQICGMTVEYECEPGFGASGPPVLLLHGWGADMSAVSGLYKFVRSTGRNAISLDLPGFGKSSAPPPHFGAYEYAETVRALTEYLGVGKVDIIGHSFGGKLGIILAANYPDTVNKLILINAAGCKPKKSLAKRLKILLYKAGKRLGLSGKNAGSADYRALGDGMKPVFVRVVNTHLDKLLKKIRAPTLILWGGRDRETPPYMARRLNAKIPDSGLAVLKNAGHFSYADGFGETCAILGSFLNSSP
jgi:pimeloyl-ACP methyl ester carboxylesterase